MARYVKDAHASPLDRRGQHLNLKRYLDPKVDVLASVAELDGLYRVQRTIKKRKL